MADLTVRGAGILGLSIAWACVKRGATVQVIDPHGPAARASGGIVGALAPHVPENWNAKKQFQLESLLMAKQFWGEVFSTGGKNPGYGGTGRLQPIADNAALALAQARHTSAKELWGDAATWDVIQANQSQWEPPSTSGWLIHDTLSAHLHPKQACMSLVSALQAKGIEITSEGPDQGPVVWATGVDGLNALNNGRNRTVGNGVKGQAVLLDFDMRGKAQLFADTLHFVPHLDGTLAIGSTSEREFDSPNQPDAKLDALLEKARTVLPAIATAPVITRWAGVRPRSRSRAPMLGPWPDKPGHYIANGGFKIGFGMAPKIADVMADLVLEQRDTIPKDFRVEASF
ncbi:MAG: FAD-dependent oxidoreductase [Paracoccaceae bacterium]